MHMRSTAGITMRFAAIALAILFARGASAQVVSRHAAAATPVGVWRGTSICLVRPSACHDEVVVYRVARGSTADSVSLDARKIVRGAEEEMAVLGCRFTALNGLLTCTMPRGTWQFHIRNDSLVGELRLTDGTKFRDVRTARSQ